jgi:predicted alpha/beta hydrolase family esterase
LENNMSAHQHFFDKSLLEEEFSTSRSLNPAAIVRGHPVIIVPGLNDSDSHHWQTLWQERIPHARRIAITQWQEADLQKWRAGIHAALHDLRQPAILIAHSFGALAAASFAGDFPDLVAGVLLVAPADPDKFAVAGALPHRPLGVPAQLIASSNDPWMTDSKAAYWALAWGANFLRLKNAGHINSHSNLGIWPQGLAQLRTLTRTIRLAETKRARLTQRYSFFSGGSDGADSLRG